MVDVLARQLDSKEWKDPLKFIPERFDSESDYYVNQNNSKRHPTSYIPFNQGIRSCPGQVLAHLETKLILVHFLSMFDYEVKKETLENDTAFFAVVSQLQ